MKNGAESAEAIGAVDAIFAGGGLTHGRRASQAVAPVGEKVKLAGGSGIKGLKRLLAEGGVQRAAGRRIGGLCGRQGWRGRRTEFGLDAGGHGEGRGGQSAQVCGGGCGRNQDGQDGTGDAAAVP